MKGEPTSTRTTEETQRHKRRNRRDGLKFVLVAMVAFVACSIWSEAHVSRLYAQSLMERFTPMLLASEQSIASLISLSELTRGNQRVDCHDPLTEVQNRIVEQQEKSNLSSTIIPKSIHVSWRDRCLPPDIVDMIEKWKGQFPHYNFYLHDDEAVDRLIFGQKWKEFPQLHKILQNCIPLGGAVKIDIWRVLLLYQYGGVYTDIDNAPGPKLTEDSILPNDTAFFVSDVWNRPSQWFQAMEPHHPIAYFTMMEIIKRVMNLEDISDFKPVYTTGPEALRRGYEVDLDFGKHYPEGRDGILSHGIHFDRYQNQIHKVSWEGDGRNYSDWVIKIAEDESLVPYKDGNATLYVTKKKRTELQLKKVHWTTQALNEKKKARGPCSALLYTIDHPKTFFKNIK